MLGLVGEETNKLVCYLACVKAPTCRQQTQHYEVEGPVALLLATAAEEPDAELANRCWCSRSTNNLRRPRRWPWQMSLSPFRNNVLRLTLPPFDSDITCILRRE